MSPNDMERLLSVQIISLKAMNESAGSIVRRVVENVRLRGYAHIKPGAIDEGPIISKFAVVHTSVLDCLKEIAQICGATLDVSPYGTVNFRQVE